MVSAELEAEIRSPTRWMYPWRLTPEVVTPVLGPELPSIHETRARMIEPVVRQALSQAGPGATVLDLGCNEGWFAHRALEWGAASVVAIDVREVNIRRAEMVREHFGIAPERLRFERTSVFDLDPEQLGSFDVVLVLGLIYHLEDPVGALRIARRHTRGTAVVEAQLTESNDPIRLGWGETDSYRETEAHWAALVEPAEEQRDDGNLLSSFGGVISLVPNRAALIQALEVVGYRDVRMLDAPPDGNRQYSEGHRGVAVGRAER